MRSTFLWRRELKKDSCAFDSLCRIATEKRGARGPFFLGGPSGGSSLSRETSKFFKNDQHIFVTTGAAAPGGFFRRKVNQFYRKGCQGIQPSQNKAFWIWAVKESASHHVSFLLRLRRRKMRFRRDRGVRNRIF